MATSNFNTLVKDSFAFLLKDYNFSIAKDEENVVRFEDDNIFITAHYDNHRSYEVGIQLGLLSERYNNEERPFELNEVIKLRQGAAFKQAPALQATSLESLKICVSKAADVFKNECITYIDDPKFNFKILSDFREKNALKQENEKRMKKLRSELTIYWGKKDYQRKLRWPLPVLTSPLPRDPT